MKTKILIVFAMFLFGISNAQTKESIKTFSTYHKNGQLKESGFFKNNLKDGQWIAFDENGIKLAEVYYDNGKKDGHWLMWDSSGIKRYEMFYENGEKIGVWTMWDENGKVVDQKNYN